jgi:hypothetical protein
LAAQTQRAAALHRLGCHAARGQATHHAIGKEAPGRADAADRAAAAPVVDQQEVFGCASQTGRYRAGGQPQREHGPVMHRRIVACARSCTSAGSKRQGALDRATGHRLPDIALQFSRTVFG